VHVRNKSFSTPSAVCALVLAVSLSVCASGVAAQAPAPNAPPLAMGLIVKLKAPAVKQSSQSIETAQSRRLRVAAVAQRMRVSYLVQKDTVLGAQVLHRGSPVAMSEAMAEAARLRADPDVEWAVPNEIMLPAAVAQPVPDAGSYSGRFWARSRLASGPGVADFPAAWNFLQYKSLTAVATAVLDSGIVDSSHPDFSGRLYTGYDFVSDATSARDSNGRDPDPTDPGDWDSVACPADPLTCSSWHGTLVTSMLTAPSDSTFSAPASTSVRMGPGILASLQTQNVVLPVRIGGAQGAASNDIIEAMYWAAGVSFSGSPPPPALPARVISLSYGSPGDCLGGSNTVDALYRNAISTLRALGVVVVGSAGNGDGNVGYVGPSKPASCQGMIAATGLRANGAKASYANLVNGTRSGQCFFGVAVASGDDGQPLALVGNTGQTSPLATQLIGGISGTSFSAPQVAGVASLMLALNPSLSSVDVAHRIMLSSRVFPAPESQACGPGETGICNCTEGTCGKGVLDAAAALALALNPREFEEGVCPSIAVRAAVSSGGGGGGGSVDGLSLFGLVLALALGLRQRLKSGKP